jgi:hypothetical protein
MKIHVISDGKLSTFFQCTIKNVIEDCLEIMNHVGIMLEYQYHLSKIHLFHMKMIIVIKNLFKISSSKTVTKFTRLLFFSINFHSIFINSCSHFPLCKSSANRFWVPEARDTENSRKWK